MLDVIICEDNYSQRKFLEDIITNEIEIKKIDMNIALSTASPDNIVKYLDTFIKKARMYFIDVKLQSSMDGFELAKIVRKYDPDGYIVFVTTHSELSNLTFQYKIEAMDFIAKDDILNIKKRIVDCIDKAYSYYKYKNLDEKFISITTGSRIMNISLNEILFFETSKQVHKVRIHTCNQQIEFYSTLKEVESLVDKNYYRCHRSYLVNVNRIKLIDKSNLMIYMINGETCYMAGRYVNGLLKRCHDSHNIDISN